MTTYLATAAPTFPELFRDDVFRLETRRLWLRWPNQADAPALHEIASLEAIARQTATWPHPFPGGEAERRIGQARAINEGGKGLRLAIATKSEPGRLIGLVGVDQEKAARTLGLGYLLSVEHQGYGVMTEAVRALVASVFRFTEFDTIRGASRVTNHASRRVMEKAGFRGVGRVDKASPARGAGLLECDALMLTRADWCKRASLRLLAPIERGSLAPNANGMPCGCAA